MIQSRQMDLDKANELLVLKGVSNGYFQINNTCTLPAQVVRLWVQDSSGNSNSWPVPLAQQVILPNQEKQFGPMPGATDQFRYWFITARGNQFSYLVQGGKGQDGVNGIDGKNGDDGKATVANGIGYLAFDFESLTYFTVNTVAGKLTLTPYPSGAQSYTMPALSNIAIGFNVTNMKENSVYTLNSKTILWSYFAAVPGQTIGPVWFIVSNSSATIDTTYKPIPLTFNVTKFIIYYPTDPLQSSFKNSQHNALAATNLLFYGDMSIGGVTKPYGQNVPFVSIYFSP